MKRYQVAMSLNSIATGRPENHHHYPKTRKPRSKMGVHSQVIFGGPSALKRRQARCCGETTHTRLRGPLRGRKGLQGLSWGARLSRLQRPPGGLDPTMQPPNSSLRQRAQQISHSLRQAEARGPQAPSSPLLPRPPPHPLAQQWALEQPGSEKKAGVMGAGGGRRAVSAEESH